jgi:hypothetical protein
MWCEIRTKIRSATFLKAAKIKLCLLFELYPNLKQIAQKPLFSGYIDENP